MREREIAGGEKERAMAQIEEEEEWVFSIKIFPKILIVFGKIIFSFVLFNFNFI